MAQPSKTGTKAVSWWLHPPHLGPLEEHEARAEMLSGPLIPQALQHLG